LSSSWAVVGRPGRFLYFPERAKEQPKIQAIVAAVRACKTK
jgi:hypothetical protein